MFKPYYPMNRIPWEIQRNKMKLGKNKLRWHIKCGLVQSLIRFSRLYLYSTKQVIIMKLPLTFALILTAAGSLSGCNALQTNDVANACQQGINELSQRLQARAYNVHQTSISRASALLESAEVQLQFAEYPGCIDKVKRADDYLSGRQTAIISRLSI